jgi:GxxExxY protein
LDYFGEEEITAEKEEKEIRRDEMNDHQNKLGAIILDAAITVHRELGPGLLESAYELALAKELSLRKINLRTQVAIELFYKRASLGKGYVIDILVEDEIIIEVKAVETMHPVYQYLKLSNRKLGYLINFNVPLLKDGFKRIVYNF